MNKTNLLLILIASFCMIGCGGKNKSNGTPYEEIKGPRTLVLYYSQTGTTKRVADEIHSLINSDIAEITPSQPYDGDYQQTIERWKHEADNDILPDIQPMDINIERYDTIFLGFPIWGGTYANPVKTLIRDNDFEGKTIITFATFGSGGISSATQDLKEALPKADVIKGYGVRNVRIEDAPKEIKRFLTEKGFIEGKVLPHPNYSPQKPVSPNEEDIFNAACGDYTYPLGRPVSFGKRTTPEGTDYKFTVDMKSPDGTKTEGYVYVTVLNDENVRPYFTSVER